MHRFAKLFEVGEYQLLVFIDATDDESDNEDYVAVHQMTDIGGALLDLTMRGPETAMQSLFDQYDDTAAANFFTLDMVKNAVSLVDMDET